MFISLNAPRLVSVSKFTVSARVNALVNADSTSVIITTVAPLSAPPEVYSILFEYTVYE